MSEEADIPDESPPDQPEIPQAEDKDPIQVWPPEDIIPSPQLPGGEYLPEETPQEDEDVGYDSPESDTEPDIAEEVRPTVFPSALASWGQSTGGTWTEQTIIYDGTHSTMSTFTDGRACGTLTAASVVTFPEEACFLTVEQPDLSNSVYYGIANGLFDVYLTASGSNYDVYIDAAKTIKLATATTPTGGNVVGATKGIGRFVGKTFRLVYAFGSTEREILITGSTVIGGTTTLAGAAYRGQFVTPTTGTFTLTGGSLTASSLGTASGSDEVYFINSYEIGQTTHDLASTSNLATVVIGIAQPSVAPDGKPIYLGGALFPGCS